ncbi:MAG: phosphotransferase [Nitrospirota bacterium]
MTQNLAQAITKYLEFLYGMSVQNLSISTHLREEKQEALKEFGYGCPLFLEYETGGERKKAVLETIAPSPYGHDHFSDRAQTILWQHNAFNSLPGHVRSLDSGAFLDSGEIMSTGKTQEFFLLTEFAEGKPYSDDLERIRNTGVVTENDLKRNHALAEYLITTHAEKKNSPDLYKRRIRDLIGHGECVMGLIDNYPLKFEFIDQPLLKKIELACVEWRWKIKHRSNRLCKVHGDFHPWNILFKNDQNFILLDRSRGEWGEAADDVACLTINYLFHSLLSSGRLEGIWEELFLAFWERYLEKTQDREILEVIAPFYAWRGLVIASPRWYPHLSIDVRKMLFNFIQNVLAAGRFNPLNVNRYLI